MVGDLGTFEEMAESVALPVGEILGDGDPCPRRWPGPVGIGACQSPPDREQPPDQADARRRGGDDHDRGEVEVLGPTTTIAAPASAGVA